MNPQDALFASRPSSAAIWAAFVAIHFVGLVAQAIHHYLADRRRRWRHLAQRLEGLRDGLRE